MGGLSAVTPLFRAAVAGIALNPTDYAAYFSGKVNITGDLTVSGTFPGDGDWADSTTFLMVDGQKGIFGYGNVGLGIHDSTHVNLGVACTTGASWDDYKYCTIGGGYGNVVWDNYGTVAGGHNNAAVAGFPTATTVSGGGYNTAGGSYATIGGGYLNFAVDYATVGGGYAEDRFDGR